MNSVSYFKRLPIFSVAAMLLSGCAVGPDFMRPAAPKVGGYTEHALPAQTSAAKMRNGEAQNFASGTDVPAQWWTLFGSADLTKLVNEALAANPDVQAAQASLRQARENTYAQEGTFFPQVDAGFSATRQKFSPAAYGIAGLSSSIFTLYDATVNVSYTLDVWGGVRRTVEAAKAQEDYQRFELEATYLTLTTNIVTAAVQEASLREQVKATQDILNVEGKSLTVLRNQFNLGGAPKSTVLEQEAIYAQAQATLPPLENQLSQTRNQLAALIGHFPSEKQDTVFTLDSLHLPDNIPVSVPSALVDRRPDVRAAEAQLHAASAEVGVATSNMLPQFTITGNYGSEAVHTGGLFASPAEVWSIGADVMQPIFHGGTLFHQRREAIAALDKANAQYRSIVLTAFRNVADALRALQYDADTLKAQLYAEQTAANSLSLAQTQFKLGAISYPQLLDTQRTYSQTRISLAQAEAARIADSAALFQALGGGWWNKTAKNDVPAANTIVAPTDAPVPGGPLPVSDSSSTNGKTL